MVHFFLALLSVLFVWKPAADKGATIEQVQWDHRLIAYVLDDSVDSGELEQSIDQWRDELLDRDILLVNLGDNELGGYPSLNLSKDEKTLWRGLWHLDSNEPRFVLVGKDGGAKALQKGELDLAQFFKLIDRMPMRQAEMRRR